jgi:anaerobic magnesium-protoporphyrin IX monomethyl ester cyclase
LDIALSFINGIRVDCVSREVLTALKKAGTQTVAYGIESGSQKILDDVNKNITISQVRRAIKLTKSVGIDIIGYFMLCFPSDTNETIKATINFARELEIIAKFSVFTPFPGTVYFDELDKAGLIATYDWSKYSVHHEPIFNHPTLSQKEIFNYYKQAYRAVYSNPTFILKQLSQIRTLDQLKNIISSGFNVINEFFR